jgi:PAS domain-containing protein
MVRDELKMAESTLIARDEIGNKSVVSGKEMSIEAALVLDCLDMDILIVSSDFKIIFANAAFLEKVEKKKEEVLGNYCYSVTHHRDSPCEPPNDPCPIKKVIETGQPSIEVHTHFNSENKSFLENVTATPLTNKNGSLGFLHIAIPVKDEIKITDEMNKALEKTQEILAVVELYQEQMMELKEKTNKLEATKKQLQSKLDDLVKFKSVVVGRELKMIELKERIAELEKKMGIFHDNK